MNEKFPVLFTLSILLRVIGWLVVIASVIYAGYEGIYEPNLPRHSFGSQDLLQLISGLAIGLFGLLTVVFSEVIGLLIGIEENTRTRK